MEPNKHNLASLIGYRDLSLSDNWLEELVNQLASYADIWADGIDFKLDYTAKDRMAQLKSEYPQYYWIRQNPCDIRLNLNDFFARGLDILFTDARSIDLDLKPVFLTFRTETQFVPFVPGVPSRIRILGDLHPTAPIFLSLLDKFFLEVILEEQAS